MEGFTKWLVAALGPQEDDSHKLVLIAGWLYTWKFIGTDLLRGSCGLWLQVQVKRCFE